MCSAPAKTLHLGNPDVRACDVRLVVAGDTPVNVSTADGVQGRHLFERPVLGLAMASGADASMAGAVATVVATGVDIESATCVDAAGGVVAEPQLRLE
jgi:hypothetical protein